MRFRTKPQISIFVRSGRLLFVCLLFFVTSFASVLEARGQDDSEELAPPPIRAVAKEDQVRLGAETDMKGYTKLAIEFINRRMSEAEALNAKQDLTGMFREFGYLHGLVDTTLDKLIRSSDGSEGSLYNLKRFDLGLRSIIPRIERIRRDLPYSYEPFVRKLIKIIQDAREKALEPMFEDTVVRRPNT